MEFKNKVYLITMLYDEPRGGTIRVAAENEDKAIDLLKKQFGSFKNFEIAQCISEDTIKPTPFSGNDGTPVLQASSSGNADDDNETPPSQRLH